MAERHSLVFSETDRHPASLLRLFRQHAQLCSTNAHSPYAKEAAPDTFCALRNRIGVLPEQTDRRRAWDIIERLVDRARTKASGQAAPGAGA